MRKWDVFLSLSGEIHRPRRVKLREAVFTPSHALVEVRSENRLSLGDSVDSMATLAFLVDSFPVRTIKLKMRGARYLGIHEGLHAYEVDLRSSLAFTDLMRGVRKFRDMTADAIVKQVLAEANLPCAFQLTKSLPSLPYCVQYRETTYDFVHRLMEHEGIHYIVDDDDVIQFCDDSPSASDVDGKSQFTLTTGEGGLVSDETTIHELSRGTQVSTGRATVNDYNWRTPKLSLMASKTGSRDTHLERYDYLVGYRDKAEGDRLAQLRLESYEHDKRHVDGKSSAIQFRPIRVFTFDHDDGVGFSGRYVLTAVEHRYAFADGGGHYENSFHAIPADVPYRPPVITPVPQLGGTHTARVVGPPGEEIHTDAYGRFKARFHWDREAKNTDEDSRWLRMLQETSSSMVLSRVGWEVIIGYVGGDPTRPVGLGRLINGQMVPTYGQPAQQNVMTIKTESYPTKAGANEIRLDDTAGAQQIYIKAEHQLFSNVKNDQSETVGHDETHDVKQTLSRSTKRDQLYKVGHDLKVKVDNNDTLSVENNRDRTVGANEKVKIEGTLNVVVEGNDTEQVGSLRRTLAGGLTAPQKPAFQNPLEKLKSSIPDPKSALKGLASGGGPPKLPNPGQALKSALPTPASLANQAKSMLSPANMLTGSIKRSAKNIFSRKVGAAQIAIAGAHITRNANMLLSETVGAVRLTKTQKQSIMEKVEKAFIRTVLGNVVQKAGENLGTSSKTLATTINGDATYTAKENGSYRSEAIIVEAKNEVVIEVGELVIKMTPGEINLAGDVRLIASDNVTVGGGPDNITK